MGDETPKDLTFLPVTVMDDAVTELGFLPPPACYSNGQKLEYWSTTYKKWAPAVMQEVEFVLVGGRPV